MSAAYSVQKHPMRLNIKASNMKKTALTSEEKSQTLNGKLPGIDIDKGLALLDGREDIYLKVVTAFIVEYSDIEKFKTQMNHLIISNLTEEAKRLAHTIKGVAGSIGATELIYSVQQLDKALKNSEKLDEKLAIFWTHLTVALNSCEKISQLNPR